ncbi:MAG: ABC transporter substrate-binding protein [Chloroflexi bacterium]|nr:ABC transporter substrate-binding protein [Chloroflexota bacterium]
MYRKAFIALTILGLLLSSCAPAAAPTPKPAPPTSAPPKPAATAPAASPAAPAPTPKPAADQSRYGGILNRANYEDPPSFDLQQEQTAPASLALFNVYQGLARQHPVDHDKTVPELAEKWEVSPDGTSYTFKFPRGIKWHDGTPFTVEDVKYSLDRMRTPREFKARSPRGEALLAAVDRSEVLGEDSIKMTLKYPSASFLLNISTGWVVVEPKHILVAKGDMKTDLVGTGPFKLKQYMPNVSLELVKNPDHHIKGLPYLDGIKMFTIKDDSSRFAAFRTGQVKMTAQGSKSMTPTQAEIVRKDMAGVAEVYLHSAQSRFTIMMNLEVEPWNNVKVRKAVDLALDRQAAIKVNGKGVIGGHFDPLGPWGMKEAEVVKLPGFRQPKDADIAEARKLMAEAGQASGFKTKVVSPVGGAQERMAVVVKDQLAKIGIAAELQPVESAVLVDRLRKRNFEVVSYSYADSTGDPTEVMDLFYVTGAGQNYSGFSDKEVDGLAAKQARAIDERTRRATLAELEKKLNDLVPWVINLWDLRLAGAWAEIKNFKPGPGTHAPSKLDQVWLAK